MRLVILARLLCLAQPSIALVITSRNIATRTWTASPTRAPRANPVIDAIIPTTSGQIGINPVLSDLGNPVTYIGEVYGTDTRYITVVASTTKWIGVNTEYLSLEGTSTVQVIIATATAAANGQNIGDVSIIIPEGLSAALRDSVKAALSLCGEVLKKARRQADAGLSCLANYAAEEAATNGVFDSFVATEKWLEAGVKLSSKASAVLKTLIATIARKDIQTKIIIFLAILAAYRYASESILIGKVNIPAEGFATPLPPQECTGSEDLTIDTIACGDTLCQGGTFGYCTISPKQRCPCLLSIEIGTPQTISFDWLSYQQQWLSDVWNGANQPDFCVTPGSQFNSSFVLRTLPLGASIVFGYRSSDGNGFRETLREKLINNGARVNYIGSKQNGNMLDNDVEAVGGLRIDEIALLMEDSLPWLPNLVLMHFGSNDATQNHDVSTAHERLGALIDRVVHAVAGVTVIVSTLIPSTNPTWEANIDIINANMPAMVETRVNQGKKVQLVDMHSGYITSADISDDNLHPTDAGYLKMANVFYDGIQQAHAKCWLTPPQAVAGLNDTVGAGSKNTDCQKIPGNTDGPYQINDDTGVDDGPYIHKGVVYGVIATGVLPYNGIQLPLEGIRWADINGDGIDDLIHVLDGPNNIATIGIVLNTGTYFAYTIGLQFYGIQAPGACKAAGMQFADFDGDGRDDLFCISPDAQLYVWLNTPGTDPGIPKWVFLGVTIAPAGYVRSQMRLGDIDGDGRADYIGISANGQINAWRHGGVGAAATTWIDMGIMIHAGSIAGDPAGFRFVDLNGDGRDDLLWVSDKGQVDTWINQRGETRSYQPRWASAGRTHSGGGVNITSRSQVAFGRIADHLAHGINVYPEYQGRGADYTYLDGPTDKSGVKGTDRIELTINDDNGGARQKGDGARYCDMRGTGADDYIWLSKTGSLQLFGNKHDFPRWVEYGVVYTPPADLMTGHSRKDIHLVDLDGDGLCDFVLVDQASGAVRVVRNQYSKDTDTFSWVDSGTWINVNCNARYGPGQFDLSVRFADLDGDGRADYLCIAPDGSALGYQNRKNDKGGVSFLFWGQVKHSEGLDRADIRFYDITGDGLADYIWLDPVTGAMNAWTNDGYVGVPATSGDSAFHWTTRGHVGGGGSLRGGCINFADINGDGRADYMDLYPQTSVADVYYNNCPGNVNPPMIPLPPLPI